jgi:hypothetical protein
MSDKTKADLLKMLAEAVLNTPGATQVSVRDEQPTPEIKTSPVRKRVAKIKRVASPSRKRARR